MPKTDAIAAAIVTDAGRDDSRVSVITDSAVVTFLKEHTAPQYNTSDIADDPEPFGAAFEQAMLSVQLSYTFLLSTISRKTVALVQTYMLDALQGLGAWVEGQSAEPPDIQRLHAKLWAVQRLAFRQDYTRNLEGGNTSDFLRSRSSLFLMKFVRLLRKAEHLRNITMGGRTTVDVTVRVRVSAPTSAKHIEEYVQQAASKLFLSNEDFESHVLKVEPVASPQKKRVIIKKKTP